MRSGERFVFRVSPGNPLLDRTHALGERGQIGRRRRAKLGLDAFRHRRIVQPDRIVRHILIEARAFQNRQLVRPVEIDVL